MCAVSPPSPPRPLRQHQREKDETSVTVTSWWRRDKSTTSRGLREWETQGRSGRCGRVGRGEGCRRDGRGCRSGRGVRRCRRILVRRRRVRWARRRGSRRGGCGRPGPSAPGRCPPARPRTPNRGASNRAVVIPAIPAPITVTSARCAPVRGGYEGTAGTVLSQRDCSAVVVIGGCRGRKGRPPGWRAR